MSHWTPEFLADRMLWVFRKRGGEGVQTKPFSQIAAKCADAIRPELHLELGEIPVLACWRSTNDWVALTTKRIVCRNHDTRHELELAQIMDATVTDDDTLHETDLGKFGLRYLTLEARDGSALRIELEAGLPFLGVWNVLHWIAYSSKSHLGASDDTVP